MQSASDSVLGKAVDKPSHAARTGGDEFAVLMPGADAHAGQTLMESLRTLVELNNQFYSGPVLGFSMGCATCDDGGRLEDALRDADVAMYEDKRIQHEGRRLA
ncbi:diguanylate cyclase domain-containing protein [Ralstonia sp. R-29]|uniref:diguanylate cyclase domain-containing protein n=1 Tax=Ralstonia sp. R-29 TaxID=3404059 RepID=UPI003CF8F68A